MLHRKLVIAGNGKRKRTKFSAVSIGKVKSNRMDVHNELDVYIPKDAEVKNLPLKSLPNSVLKRMSLFSDRDASRKSADTPDVIWICPAVLRRKGQRPASCHGTGSSENTRTLLAAKSQAGLDPLQMSFVCSNQAAWVALKSISSGVHISKTQAVQDSAPPVSQNAVIIYRGQVYLCIRSKKSQGHPKAHELQKSSQHAVPSTSELLSKTSKQELVSDSSQKMKRTAGTVKHLVKKDVVRKAELTVGSEHDAAQPPDSKHKENAPFGKVLRPELASEDAAPPPAYVQLQEGQINMSSTIDYDMHDVGDENGSAIWNNNLDVQMDSQDSDQIMDHTWTIGGSVGSAAASSSLHKFDFTELENEEKIAQLKAKFMLDDAALNDLPF